MKLLRILSILFTLLSFHAIPSLCTGQYSYTVRFSNLHLFTPSRLEHYKEVAETSIGHNVLTHSPSYPEYPHLCLPIHIQTKLTLYTKGWPHH
jgi:hypothetical protein